MLRAGKLPPELLADLLDAGGPAPPELRLGLVAATDPITLTGSGVGSHSVVINANDVAVMGVRPRWFLATILLPEGSREGLVRELFETMREALHQIGASLVGGHTEVTAAVRQPVIAGQMLGVARDALDLPIRDLRPPDVRGPARRRR